MPELPEVETVARGVNKHARGQSIEDVWFAGHRQPFLMPAARQARLLRGRTILDVHRTGKHIVCELSAVTRAGEKATEPAAQWIVHLGMTGRLLVCEPDAPLEAHTHARLQLSGGRELRFIDPRRFGRLDFRDLAHLPVFTAPGAEPLTIESSAFAALFRGRKLCIKAALLNQELLSGVGNIYADESLFQAGIAPRRRAGRLSYADLERLRVALREVLRAAIRLGGSSVSDYVNAEGAKGFFQQEHCVYQRTGEPCRRCQKSIRRIVVAGRGTHYCPQCQR